MDEKFEAGGPFSDRACFLLLFDELGLLLALLSPTPAYGGSVRRLGQGSG